MTGILAVVGGLAVAYIFVRGVIAVFAGKKQEPSKQEKKR
jgi:hypothetical protein